MRTFVEMVAEHGYDLTSVGAIAGALNLSKGTIMYHFGSKDRMLQQMSLDYMRRRLSELEVIVQSSASSTEQLTAVITGLMVAFRDDRAPTIAFSREFTRFANEPVMAEVRELRRQYVKMLSQIVRDGVTAGELRPTDPEILTLQIIGMCNWSWTWLRPDGRIAPEEVGALFSAVVIDGIAAPPSDRRSPGKSRARPRRATK